jgi:hypothetical protein
LKIADIEFDGPYGIDTTSIPADRAAVYVIICKSSDGKYHVIDVGESGETGIRLANHERRPCWVRNCGGVLFVYLRYMPASEGFDAASRRLVERKIRERYNPPCGKI